MANEAKAMRWARRDLARILLILGCAAVLLAPVRVPYRVLIVAVVAIAATVAQRRSVAPLGMRRSGLIATLAWAAAFTLLAAGLVGEVLQPALERLTGESADYSGYGALRGDAAAALALWSYAMVSAAIGEEIVFRGFLLSQAEMLLGSSRAARATAVVGSAILFGLCHARQGLAGIVSTGLIGLVAGLIWYRSGRNLWALILGHGLTDSYGIAMLYIGRFA